MHPLVTDYAEVLISERILMRTSHVFMLVISCLFPLSALSLSPIDGVFRGRVNMQGAIIDDACAISVESSEQTIDMETIPLAEIIRDGMGRSKIFSILLVRCSTERSGKGSVKKFRITFDGERDGELFGVNGDASGVALQITDVNGKVAIPGGTMPLEAMDVDNGKLNYTLKLKSNQRALKAGDYFSSIRFKLDYF